MFLFARALERTQSRNNEPRKHQYVIPLLIHIHLQTTHHLPITDSEAQPIFESRISYRINLPVRTLPVLPLPQSLAETHFLPWLPSSICLKESQDPSIRWIRLRPNSQSDSDACVLMKQINDFANIPMAISDYKKVWYCQIVSFVRYGQHLKLSSAVRLSPLSSLLL